MQPSLRRTRAERVVSPGQRGDRMVARRRGNPFGVRKVRAPQRRVAGNSRPPRGEDQRHSDDAVLKGPGPQGRSETRQALPGARPNRRAQPGLPGERRAAQPSGRLHEPTGNRRPQMDGHPRGRFGGCGTELGLQVASLALPRLSWMTVPSCRVDQSSSGRKMCAAVQLLQTSIATSRSPMGIGTLRSG